MSLYLSPQFKHMNLHIFIYIIITVILLVFVVVLLFSNSYPYQHSERHVCRSIQYNGIGVPICFMLEFNLCSFIVNSSTPRWKINYVFPSCVVFNACFNKKTRSKTGWSKPEERTRLVNKFLAVIVKSIPGPSCSNAG